MAKVLTDAQVADIAVFGGWTANSPDLTTSVAVSLAENQDSDPTATHKNTDGSTDYGLWQVNSIHGYPVDQLLTSTGNARAAFEVWKSSGWEAWSTFKSGAYLLFLPRAKSAVASGTGQGRDPGVAAGTGSGVAPTLTTLDVIVKALGGFVGWVGNPHNWMRVAEVTIGGALVIAGLSVVANSSKAVKSVKGIVP
jgi:hypothetical protein